MGRRTKPLALRLTSARNGRSVAKMRPVDEHRPKIANGDRMGQGILSGILGDEDKKPEVEAPETVAGAEAFASAVAAKLAGNDPEVARKTVEFLTKQSQLLDTQNKHLKDEHEARLHFLQGQVREEDIRRLGLRLRVSIQCFLVLVATVIGIGLVLVIHDAVESRNVVIDPFDAPPSLAADGFSDKVLASRLLDVLTKIQAANRSSAEHRSL